MSRYVPLLEKIRKQPGLWLGSWSVMALWYWLQGYDEGLTEAQASFDEVDRVFWRGFEAYVEKDYNVEHCGMSWAHLILDHCNGSEPETYDEFYRLLDGFLKNTEGK